MVLRAPFVALALAGCTQSGVFTSEVPPLTLAVDGPTYGAFAGAGPVVVSGRVSHDAATVWVEGYEAVVGTDGSFRVEVPIEGAWRMIDVEAADPTAHLHERIPVFSGGDPLLTWPGGLSLLLTPGGLDALADSLTPLVDEAVAGLGIFQAPTTLTLEPTAAGLELMVGLHQGVLSVDAGGFPVSIGLEHIWLGGVVRLGVAAEGALMVAFTDVTVDLADPIIEAGDIDPFVLENLAGGLIDALDGFIEGVIDGALQTLGALQLGGPIAFQTDLLGTPMAFSIASLNTWSDGVGGVLGLTLGDSEADPLDMPAPSARAANGDAHLVVGVHEGLFQLLLTSDLLDLLEQDLEIGGVFGDVLGMTITSLPGGHAAPDADGWCLSVSPGDARVARMMPGTDPLAVLYLPDLVFDVGVTEGAAHCTSWLEASLAVEVGFRVTEGTRLAMDIEVVDGDVLHYATTGLWEEQEVVDQLGGLLDTFLGLVGGAIEIDLADILGGGLIPTGGGTGTPLGDLQLLILDSEPMVDEALHPVDGLYALSLRLW